MPDAIPPVQIPQVKDDAVAMYLAIGQLTAAVNANAKAAEKNADVTERNTVALQKMEVRLVQGDARMDRQDARHNDLPCVSGKPLPPGCPGISSTPTVEVPVLPGQTPEEAARQAGNIAAAMSTWRLAKRFGTWAQERGHWIASCALALLGLGSLFGGKLGELCRAVSTLFAGGTPPPGH